MKRKKRIKIGVLLLFLGMVQTSYTQGIFGKWKTIDDNTGTAKAIVEVYEENGKMNAKILQVLEKGRENAKCIKCKGDLKDKPIKGMHIISNFKQSDEGEYKGSNLLDPESGTTYRGKVWLDPNDGDKLKVRGYVAFLYRTQTWHRVTEP
nr:DUF2147 domain-containing protein [Allomuricauda sp.]